MATNATPARSQRSRSSSSRRPSGPIRTIDRIGATGEVHPADVRPTQRALGALRAEAQDELIADHAAGHVLREHECDPPEHEPLVEVGDIGEGEANALGERLVEGHRHTFPVGADAAGETVARGKDGRAASESSVTRLSNGSAERGGGGQHEGDPRTTAGTGLGPDAPSLGLDEPLAIASPRPAPPPSRRRAESARQNRSNARSRSAAGSLARVLDADADPVELPLRPTPPPSRRRACGAGRWQGGWRARARGGRGAPRRRRGRIHAGLDPHAPRLGARGDPAHAAVHQAIETHVAQLHGQLSPVDARELEEVIDQAGEVAHLVSHGREVLLGGCEPVLDGLKHRLERREGGAQVVAGMSHQLAACLEEPLELPRHAVEGRPELGQLGGAGLGCPCGQVAA